MKSARPFAAAPLLALALAACGSHNEEAENQPMMTGAAPAPAAAGATDAADPAGQPDAAALPSPGESPAPEASPSATPSTAASASPAPAATRVAAAAPASPPPGFVICSACHSVERGEHGIGPSLAGVYGTKAGAIPGYDFSEAMKASGLTWNEANLDRYLADPMAVIPGTKMAYAGLKNDAQRKAVIEYLKGL